MMLNVRSVAKRLYKNLKNCDSMTGLSVTNISLFSGHMRWSDLALTSAEATVFSQT